MLFTFQIIASFFLALTFTLMVRHFSFKYGKVAEVRSDRWHKTPIPLLGGIAIWLAWASVSLLTVPPGSTFLMVLAGGTAIFVLGLVDDFLHINPQSKLIIQIVVAVAMIKGGVYVTISPYPALNFPLTILWIVGITNAFNLLDNMDGLSAGIAAISAAVLLFFSVLSGAPEVAILTAPLIGAALGFLRYNFNPAKIFMGDCGSMFLGFILANLSILGTWRHASNLIVTMAVPILILAIPIFDTTFVTITRKIAGRPLSQGGRDHLSHRLVAMGLSEKQAVLWLYAISILAGFLSVFFSKLNPTLMLVGCGLIAVPLYFLGVFLGEIEVYAKSKEQEEVRKRKKKSATAKKRLPVARKTVAEMLIDILLFTIAYSSAYYIKYDSEYITLYNIESAGSVLVNYFDTLPWVVLLKCVVFYFFGLYRSIWRYVGVREMIDVVKAVTLCTVLIVSVSLVRSDFVEFSRTIFIIDWMSTLLLVGGSRFLLRALKELFTEYRKGSRKVLLVGAEEGGDMVLREIRNNSDYGYNIVGLINDDPGKKRIKIHNVPVVGTISSIPEIVKGKEVVNILIALPLSQKKAINRVISICDENSIPYERVPVMDEVLGKNYAETGHA